MDEPNNCGPNSAAADDPNVMTEQPMDTNALARKKLADAIEATGQDNERLARRTWGEVSADLVADLRQQRVSPLPPWYQISRLLGVCGLSAAQVGQPIRRDDLVVSLPPARRPPRRSGPPA